MLLALLLGHGVDVGGLGVGIGRQQLGDGLAPDVLNAEQLDGARAVGCDMVVQIVKVTHIFPFPGHGLPLVFHCRYYNTPFGKWKVSIRSAGRRQIAQTLPHGAENFLAAICRFPFASGKNVGIMILYENMDICACAQDAEFFKKRGSYDMIPHGKEIKVFTGSSNPELADMICKNLGISLGKSTVTAFADGECSISINEPVRGVDVFIVQSTCKPVNDSLMELLVMIDAMKRASAGRITAVIPYFGYARQDRKAKARDPISAKLVANLLTIAGADRVLTMDLHAAQIQGFFDIPVDNLYGAPLFASHYLRRFGYGREDLVVVSPDVGSVARARSFAMKMGVGLAIVDKRREKANCSEVMNIIGNVEGKTCLLLDDMVDTAGSLCGAAKAIVEVGGAKEVFACASHGVLSGPAIDRINDSVIDELLLLDTIPYPKDKPACDKIHYLPVAPVFAEAINRIYEEMSISSLFE